LREFIVLMDLKLKSKLFSAIDHNQPVQFTDLNTTTSLIKLYLRDASDPLFLYSNFDTLKDITALPDDKQCDALRNLIRCLPIPNFLILILLFQHMRKILEHSEANKMNARAISVCIGPAMIRAPEGRSNEAINESSIQQTIAILLLTKYDEIFGAHPLFVYNSTGQSRICRLISEQGNAPFALNAPKDSIVQVVADDNNGWSICVFNDQWGAVPSKSLEEVTGREIAVGLAKQTKKWDLSPEDIQSITAQCPEAAQLYNILLEKIRELRGKVARAAGVA